MALDPRRGAAAPSSAASPGSSSRVDDRGGERRQVAERDDPGGALAERVLRAGDVGDHEAAGRGHRFQHRKRHALPARGCGDDVRGREPVGHVGALADEATASPACALTASRSGPPPTSTSLASGTRASTRGQASTSWSWPLARQIRPRQTTSGPSGKLQALAGGCALLGRGGRERAHVDAVRDDLPARADSGRPRRGGARSR